MPEPAFDEKQEIRDKCLICNQTPTRLHTAHVLPDSTQAPDKGKAIVEDNNDDAGGVKSRNLASVASSSSSSSAAETEENSLLSSSSSSSQQRNEAKDTKDELEALSSPNGRPALSTSEAPVREERLFEDMPGQAGLGSGIEPHMIVQLVQRSEEPADLAEGMAVDTIPVVTYQVPSFSMALGGGIDSFSDEFSSEDPDNVGLEGLGILWMP